MNDQKYYWREEEYEDLIGDDLDESMLFGPDDSLYLSIHGAFSPPGSGAVLRFDKLTHWTQEQLPIQYSP